MSWECKGKSTLLRIPWGCMGVSTYRRQREDISKFNQIHQDQNSSDTKTVYGMWYRHSGTKWSLHSLIYSLCAGSSWLYLCCRKDNIRPHRLQTRHHISSSKPFARISANKCLAYSIWDNFNKVWHRATPSSSSFLKTKSSSRQIFLPNMKGKDGCESTSNPSLILTQLSSPAIVISSMMFIFAWFARSVVVASLL